MDETAYRHLNLQIQPDRAPSLDVEFARRVVEAVSEDHAIVAGYHSMEGEDHGVYINFTFLAKDVAALWRKLQADVLGNAQAGSEIARASIVTCEGENGWEDYLLLHHFDPKLPLDRLPGAQGDRHDP